MKYKSGNIYFTPAGAFLFVGEKEKGTIKVITLFKNEKISLFKNEKISLPHLSDTSSGENFNWIDNNGRKFPVINIYDIIKKEWYEKW